MTPSDPQRSIAIFSARESVDTLLGSIKAAIRACGNVTAIVDILVNGNRPLADAVAPFLAGLRDLAPSCTVRLWFIPMGDKGHTWNQFLHEINPKAEYSFFIDGYVAVRADALQLIEDGLKRDPKAVAATGLPSSGRSAAALRQSMIQNGGLHGNLFAMRRSVLLTLAERGFRLPLGIYRNDSLLATVCNYNLSPAENEVDTKRVMIQANATWDVMEDATALRQKISTHLKRKLRQGQGDLENYALHHHFTERRLRPEALPATSAVLVKEWVHQHPREYRELWLKNPLILHAFSKISQTRDWSAAERKPLLVFSSQAEALTSQP